MKYKLINLFLLFSISNLIAKEQVYNINQSIYTNETYTCFIEYIVQDGYNNNQPFKPKNNNLKTIIISFKNKMDSLEIESTNYNSTFKYLNFIDLPHDSMGIKQGTLGITYYEKKSAKQCLYYDIFENGKLLIWLDNKILSSFFCPNLKLDIKRIK